MTQDDPQNSITITITEYNSLLEDSLMLEALDVTGVDNWEGYTEALELYNEAKSR